MISADTVAAAQKTKSQRGTEKLCILFTQAVICVFVSSAFASGFIMPAGPVKRKTQKINKQMKLMNKNHECVHTVTNC